MNYVKKQRQAGGWGYLAKVKRRTPRRIRKRVPHMRKSEKLRKLKEFAIQRDGMPQIDQKFALKFDNSGLRVIKGRLDFSSAVKGKMPVGFGMARCHSFSQDFIAAILQNIIDLFIGNPNEGDTIYLMLKYLGNMIFGGEADSGEKSCYIETIQNIFSISYLQEAVDLANMLMCQLNNSLYNLRPGDMHWNSSISYSFDPVSWDCVIMGSDGRPWYISEKSIDPMPDSTGRSTGIYLTDDRDSSRLQRFIELRDVIEDDYTFGIDLYSVTLDNGVYGVVGSSSNCFSKNTLFKPDRYNQIYIKAGGTWQLIC